MGCQHSTPAPTEMDLAVAHRPPTQLLCKSLPPTGYGDTALSKSDWQLETPVPLGSLKFVPGGGRRSCALYQDTTPVALMHLKDQKALKAGIFAFAPCHPNQTNTAEHHGAPLYQWATVTMEKGSGKCTMIVEAEDCTYKTEFYGSRWSHDNCVVLRDGVVCASLKDGKEWICRICPKIDPALLVCFVACIDRLRMAHEDNIQKLSHRASYDFKNLF